jgi:transcriptional regulator with XRE-family HTH domain
MFDLVALGAAIKRLRINARMSQQELAASAGVHRTYVSDVENGRRNVTLEILYRISSGLGVKLSKLTGMAEVLASRSQEAGDVAEEAGS